MVDITTVSHDTKTPENYSKYLDRIDSYLEVCKGKTVLEIGPCHWMMSERILSKNPISLDTIEPDPYAHNRKPAGLTNHLMTANDFFAKDKRSNACDIPAGKTVVENKRTGLPFLKKA